MADTLLNLTPFVAAAILAFAALAKAINARPALSALRQTCPFLSPTTARVGLILIVATQSGLAMLLLVAPSSAIAGIALLFNGALLSANLTARWRGSTGDCGCYGRFTWLGPREVFVLDVVLMLSFSLTIFSDATGATTLIIPVLAAILFALSTAYLTQCSLHQGRLWPRPLFCSGSHWPILASKFGLPAGGETEQYTLFISEDCAQCGRTLRVLQLAQGLGLLPPTRLVMAEGQSLYENSFPLILLSESRFNRLVDSVPQLVISRGNIVKDLWLGQLPPTLVAQVRQARASQGTSTQTGEFPA